MGASPWNEEDVWLFVSEGRLCVGEGIKVIIKLVSHTIRKLVVVFV